ncbi:extracellular solute-binding protein [Salibacterium halotolerans]|uniref:Raffinose/stachyose/melibiose transport system substrate-binding protein n=1 Tax=Salibacterium halotolerans TaxID=1884432 RepID=A0A1I5L1S4_9BACI|nr:extracellular solute-binding protein [Salibacterium halotolerans]SFO91284.1 raffinose/stachyose/melibiose transport system substrate-binding protein [Salibacterium halotolerans]
MKKYAVVLICSLAVLAAGCQPSSENAETPEGGSDSGGSSENKELSLWHIETGEAEKVLQEAAQRFEEEHEGVTVELNQYQNDPYKEQIITSMGGDSPPDIFHSWGGGWLKNFVDSDQVMNITEDINPDNYLQTGLDTVTFNEEIYGVPVGMELTPVWYNTAIFEEYDLEVPETYDDLLGIVETLRANDIIPFALANQPQWPGAFYMMYLAERIGGPDLFNEAYNRTGRTFDDEAYIEAGQKIQELVDMGAFPDGVNGMNYDNGQSRQLMYSGDAAMEIMNSGAMLNNVRKEMPEFEEKLDYFLFPEVEGGQGSQNHAIGGVSPAFSISSKTEHPDLALELLKELSSQETAQGLADRSGNISAVQGVEYEDGYIERLNSTLNEANYLQTFYDQTLPPEVAQVHLDTTQGLFGKSITPEEAAQEVEQAAQEVLE